MTYDKRYTPAKAMAELTMLTAELLHSDIHDDDRAFSIECCEGCKLIIIQAYNMGADEVELVETPMDEHGTTVYAYKDGAKIGAL